MKKQGTTLGLFLLLCLATVHKPLFAQPFTPKLYTTADGLPDATLNAIYQDSKGYLWLGTRTSLCRFNGRDFVNYGKELGNGFTGSVVLEDSRHRYWLNTKSGVALLRNKQLVYYPTSDGLKVDWLFSFTELQNGKLWMLSDKGIYEFEDSLWRKRNLAEGYTDRPCRFAVEVPGGIYLSYGHQLFFWPKTGPAKPITPRHEEYPYYIWLKKYNGQAYVNSFEGLFRIVSGSLVRLFAKELSGYSYDFLVDRKGRTWVSTETEGLRVSDAGNETALPHHIEQPFNQTLLLTEDREGNVWAANYEGLLRVNESRLQSFDTLQSRLLDDIRHLAVRPDGRLLIQSQATGFFDFSNGRFTADKQFGSKALSGAVVDASAYDAEGRLWIVTRRGQLFRVSAGGVEDLPPAFKNEFFQSLANDAGNRTLYVCGRQLYATTGGPLVPLAGSAAIPAPVRVFRSGGNTVVATRDSGIYLLTTAGLRRAPELSGAGRTDANFDLVNDPAGGFWTASIASGLQKFTWGANGTPVLQARLTEADGLPNNYCTALTFDKSGRLWVATLAGLVVVERDGQGRYTAGHLTEEALLHFGNWMEAQLVTDSAGTVWLSSFHKLIAFDAAKVTFDKAVPNVVISDVQLNLEPTNWSRWTDSVDGVHRLPLFANLPYNRNTVSLSFDAVTFSNNGQCLFAYKLDGLHADWQNLTSSRSVSFANLAPGTYTFRVKARKPNTDWSREAVFSFVIRRPFWSTWWFQLLLILAAVAAIGLFVRARVRRIRTKAAVERQLQELDLKALRTTNALMQARQELASAEMQALRAQMNPHFIYNALNSIQSLVLDGRPSEAVKYLGKFARLLRQVLEHSDNNLITLEKELSTLQLYVQLETLRLNAALDFEIDMDEQLLPEKELVPPLILQPYVENALWHGLSRKDGERRLRIGVRCDEEWLFVSIVDNGIGRQAAAAHKKDSYPLVESKGMAITAQRLKALNEDEAVEVVTVHDLVAADGLPAGTEVILQLRRITKV